MSYDLHIYGSEIDSTKLRAAVEVSGLIVDDGDSRSGSFTVVRGKSAKYSFTVGSPVGVDPEDVPEEVTAAVLGPTHLVDIVVEGSADTEVLQAIRAARRISVAMDGAVLDPQTDEVFRRGRARSVEPVERGLVSIVDVRWYVRSRQDDPARTARAFVTAARRHLPEALPRRYGSSEPLQERWEDGGEEAFVAYVGDAESSVYMKGSGAVASASIGRAWRRRAVVHAHGLSFLATPLEDERWRAALERMFVELAQTLDVVYASAEVVRGIEWSGRTLWYGSEAERTTYLAPGNGWLGLTPYPVWLAWFGTDYAPLVRRYLGAQSVTAMDNGLLHRRSVEALDRDALIARVPDMVVDTSVGSHRWFGSRRSSHAPGAPPSWLPTDLLAAQNDRDPVGSGLPGRAQRVPRSLRG